jgi:polysaccharide biosynthesis/export protein
MKQRFIRTACVVAVWSALSAAAAAQNVPTQEGNNGAVSTAGSATLPSDYVIGKEDVLSIIFWRDKELSGDVVVRPDGKITLPLLKDIQAAGYTPEQLTDVVVKAASKYISQPTATVIVKQINSRKVFVIGQVARPGGYMLSGELTVLQLIAMAGDVLEYAKSSRIVVVRKKDDGREERFRFNYNEVVTGRKAQQNILLRPGDTVIVP